VGCRCLDVQTGSYKSSPGVPVPHLCWHLVASCLYTCNYTVKFCYSAGPRNLYSHKRESTKSSFMFHVHMPSDWWNAKTTPYIAVCRWWSCSGGPRILSRLADRTPWLVVYVVWTHPGIETVSVFLSPSIDKVAVVLSRVFEILWCVLHSWAVWCTIICKTYFVLIIRLQQRLLIGNHPEKWIIIYSRLPINRGLSGLNEN
jgi:hypothetical protein